jgi:uridine kinase
VLKKNEISIRIKRINRVINLKTRFQKRLNKTPTDRFNKTSTDKKRNFDRDLTKTQLKNIKNSEKRINTEGYPNYILKKNKL